MGKLGNGRGRILENEKEIRMSRSLQGSIVRIRL